MIPPRWQGAVLVAAALVPFAPLLLQAARLGVPDTLLIGDAAVMELRTRQAADGVQLLGPYSRFYWSHPGPAFFYLALPFYELLGEKGAALNLAALVMNAATAVAIVLTARRLRGGAFAWMTAAGIAVLALVVLPLLPASAWNPFTPILPLVLLSLLTAQLALGAVAHAPLFAFLASAIVQTHVGCGPVVAALTVVAIVGGSANRTGSRRALPATAAVLILCWALPVYEEVAVRPGNLTQLWHFFKGGNPEPHPWTVVIATLGYQLVLAPVVVAVFAFARRRQDATLQMLATIAIAEVAVAIPAIRAIRGELHPYLLYWTAVPGFMTLAVVAAWVVKTRWRVAAAVAVGAVAVALIARAAPHPEWRLYDPPDPAVAQVALDIERAITAAHLERPLVRVVEEDAWITAAAALVHLEKRGLPYYVEPGWTFMFGKENEDPGGHRPRLLIGDRTFRLEL